MQYHAIPCNTMQYHAISCNTMQYHAIQCNTMQYHAKFCNTMQYHVSLITADGAYHCPVGSIRPFFNHIPVLSLSLQTCPICLLASVTRCSTKFLRHFDQASKQLIVKKLFTNNEILALSSFQHNAFVCT